MQFIAQCHVLKISAVLQNGHNESTNKNEKQNIFTQNIEKETAHKNSAKKTEHIKTQSKQKNIPNRDSIKKAKIKKKTTYH